MTRPGAKYWVIIMLIWISIGSPVLCGTMSNKTLTVPQHTCVPGHSDVPVGSSGMFIDHLCACMWLCVFVCGSNFRVSLVNLLRKVQHLSQAVVPNNLIIACLFSMQF